MTADVVRLVTPAGENSDWESYEMDADMMTPSDAWQLVLGHPKPGWMGAVKPGDKVELFVNNQLQFTGLVDTPTGAVSRERSALSIQGRDKAGSLLVDCAAPILSMESCKLKELIQRVATDAGVTEFLWLPGSVDPIPMEDEEYLKTNPGESCWDVIWRYASRMGLGMWTTEQGALAVGRPNYIGPPSLTFEHHLNAPDNARTNVETLSYQTSISGRYSKVIVYGQRQGNQAVFGDAAAYDFVGEAEDADVPYKKVLRIVDSSAKSQGRVQRRAEAEVALRKLEGTMIEVWAKGHSQNGQAYGTNRLAMVKSDLLGVDDTYWIYRRRFTMDREKGQRTYMVLGPAGIWGVYGR